MNQPIDTLLIGHSNNSFTHFPDNSVPEDELSEPSKCLPQLKTRKYNSRKFLLFFYIQIPLPPLPMVFKYS